MGEKKLPPGECEYQSCNGLSQYEVAHTETAGKNRRVWLCREHKNTECLHDPTGTEIVTRPHEIVDPRKVQRGDDE